MLPANFKLAMFNEIQTGPYEEPGTVGAKGIEWLIVERAGPVIQISDGNKQPSPASEVAPPDLGPNNTLVGLRIDTDVERGDETFLLVRRLPTGVETSGNFFPADGFARISVEGNQIRLKVHGRHYHHQEVRNGQPILVDIAIPPAAALQPGGSGGGINWHFDAERRPWVGEAL
jgi:hypothetical protein